jgi:predicted nuclease of predicted toxin-antitoxin system
MPEGLRLYLDQCLRLEVAEALRYEGYDVVRAAEVGQARADDLEILQRAESDRRVLITLDEHFGNWAVLPLGEHFGVIRVKISPATPANVISLLLPFLSNRTHEQFQNNLVIVSAKRARWVCTARSVKPKD